MGSITRSLSNNITTGGVILPAGITNASVSAVTSFANASGGTLTLLSTQTASASASISFTTGLDSTYDLYEFHFINVHPSAEEYFTFNGSTNGGSSYGVINTISTFSAYHNESDTQAGVAYLGGADNAQSTNNIILADNINSFSPNDGSASGILQLFNPSSTTYVKHFINNAHTYYGITGNLDYAINWFTAGYFNTTSAINAVRFQMNSGNIDDGIIKMYGVKKS
jgi:hypothetical protein